MDGRRRQVGETSLARSGRQEVNDPFLKGSSGESPVKNADRPEKIDKSCLDKVFDFARKRGVGRRFLAVWDFAFGRFVIP